MHTAPAPSPPPAPFTGRKMLIWMLAFFGVVIAANLIMMAFALRTHTGTVVPNSYVASQDFNARIADDQAQRSLGWRIDFAFADGAIRLSFDDRDGRPIGSLDIRGVIGRPVDAAFDRPLRFEERAPGRYVAKVELGPGEWRMEAVAAEPEGVNYRLIRDVFVRSDGG